MKLRPPFALGSSLVFASALILAASLTVVGCGGGGSVTTPTSPTPTPAPGPSPTPDPGTADVIITITGMNGAQSYSPNPATITAGKTVSWRNGDTLPHTATADGGAFGTTTLAPGATSTPILMSTAGSFPYHCAVHPSMTGTLVVVAADSTGNGGY